MLLLVCSSLTDRNSTRRGIAPEEAIASLLLAQEERINKVAIASSTSVVLWHVRTASKAGIAPDFAILVLFLHKLYECQIIEKQLLKN